MNWETIRRTMHEAKAEILGDELDLIDLSQQVAEEQSVGGYHGAETDNDVSGHGFFEYMAELVSDLMDEGLSEDDALQAVTAFASKYEEDEDLPPLPENDEDAEALAAWVAAAQSMGFAGRVMSAAVEG